MKWFVAFALSALFILPSTIAPETASAQELTLDSLLSRFSEMPGLQTRFREEKRIALLAVPIRSEGEIFFSSGRLLRRVTSPTESAALIDEGSLVMRDQNGRETIDLDQNAVVRAFVESFGQVLAGNRGALERTYRMQFEVEDDRWTLTLRPRGEALSRFLTELTLTGVGPGIDRMTMIERSGDSTTTEFFDVDPERRFSTAEVARIFSL